MQKCSRWLDVTYTSFRVNRRTSLMRAYGRDFVLQVDLTKRVCTFPQRLLPATCLKMISIPCVFALCRPHHARPVWLSDRGTAVPL